MRVTGTDGRRWRIRRVWLYWPPRLPGVFIRPTVVYVAALSIGVQVLLLPFVTLLKIARRRPFRLEAWTSDKPRDERAWEVVGFRASSRARRTIRDAIAHGFSEIRVPGARRVPFD